MGIRKQSFWSVPLKKQTTYNPLTEFCPLVPAFAVPVIDGFLDVNEYNNSFTTGWYNGHHEADSQFKKDDDHTTTVYWKSTATNFYLYIEAPLEAKNMIWGTGFTGDDYNDYFQHWHTHHNKT